MIKTKTIYLITHQKNPIYVGQTVNFNTRKTNHMSHARHYRPDHHHHNWRSYLAKFLNGLPEDEIVFTKLGECQKQHDADELERQYISSLKPKMNLATGGRSGFLLDGSRRNLKHSQSIKKVSILGTVYESVSHASKILGIQTMSLRHRILSPMPRWSEYKAIS